jgi:hypothetical protein
MPGRGGELANVLQDLELKKCFHQFLRENAEDFDGAVEGGPCRPVPRAGERKQPFQYALAQSRDLLQVENIVFQPSGRRHFRRKKTGYLGGNPRPRSFLPLDYRRGGAPGAPRLAFFRRACRAPRRRRDPPSGRDEDFRRPDSTLLRRSRNETQRFSPSESRRERARGADSHLPGARCWEGRSARDGSTSELGPVARQWRAG